MIVFRLWAARLKIVRHRGQPTFVLTGHRNMPKSLILNGEIICQV